MHESTFLGEKRSSYLVGIREIDTEIDNAIRLTILRGSKEGCLSAHKTRNNNSIVENS